MLLNERDAFLPAVKLDGGMQFEEIDFRVERLEKGAARIEVVIEPFDNECRSSTTGLQEASGRERKSQRLYLEGNARWEYRYLRAILKRDPASTPLCRIQRRTRGCPQFILRAHGTIPPFKGRRVSIRLGDSGERRKILFLR